MQRKRPFILIRTIPGALAELRSVRRMLREALTFQVKGTVWTKDTLVWRWMHSRSWQQSSVFIAEIGSSTQFSSVTSNSLWLHGLHCSTPGFPVYHQLLELAQTCVYWVGDAIQPSHSLSSPFFSWLQSFPASGSFPMSQFFTSGGQSIGVSASASVLPMNIQDWFLLGWTGWISL